MTSNVSSSIIDTSHNTVLFKSAGRLKYYTTNVLSDSGFLEPGCWMAENYNEHVQLVILRDPVKRLEMTD